MIQPQKLSSKRRGTVALYWFEHGGRQLIKLSGETIKTKMEYHLRQAKTHLGLRSLPSLVNHTGQFGPGYIIVTADGNRLYYDGKYNDWCAMKGIAFRGTIPDYAKQAEYQAQIRAEREARLGPIKAARAKAQADALVRQLEDVKAALVCVLKAVSKGNEVLIDYDGPYRDYAQRIIERQDPRSAGWCPVKMFSQCPRLDEAVTALADQGKIAKGTIVQRSSTWIEQDSTQTELYANEDDRTPVLHYLLPGRGDIGNDTDYDN